MNVTVDVKDINRLERDLRLFNERGIDFAASDALTDAAVETMREAKRIVTKTMIIRNTWTVRNISFNRSSVRTMRSETGVNVMRSKDGGRRNDYMVKQEFGAVEHKKHKHGVALPSGNATGEGPVTPRKKAVGWRSPNRLKNMNKLAGRERKWKNRKQANIVAVRMAQKKKPTSYAYIEKNGRRGIVKVTGGKRNPKIKVMHDLSHNSVDIPKSPWLQPAKRRTLPMIPGMYKKQLQRQIDRLGVFK